jgi:quercetin dioxygenase-like cupin family protein
MAVYTANANDVPLEKSGRGFSKYLIKATERGATSVMIRHWGPDTDIPVHSHPFNEMFYVLDGEIEVGGVTYSAGACIFIEKGTEYGPTYAPKGGTVLRYAEGRST